MDWIKSILVGRRTYLMVVIAAALHYAVGVVADPFLLDVLTHARDAAFLTIPVFIRLGIKAAIK